MLSICGSSGVRPIGLAYANTSSGVRNFTINHNIFDDLEKFSLSLLRTLRNEFAGLRRCFEVVFRGDVPGWCSGVVFRGGVPGRCSGAGGRVF